MIVDCPGLHVPAPVGRTAWRQGRVGIDATGDVVVATCVHHQHGMDPQLDALGAGTALIGIGTGTAGGGLVSTLAAGQHVDHIRRRAGAIAPSVPAPAAVSEGSGRRVFPRPDVALRRARH